MKKEELMMGDWVRFSGYIPTSYEGFTRGEFTGVFVRWTGDSSKATKIQILRHNGKVDTRLDPRYYDSKAVVYRKTREAGGLMCYVPIQMIRSVWRIVK